MSENIVKDNDAGERLPTAAEILVDTGEVLDNAEGFKYLSWLEQQLIAYHNTNINPKHLQLRDFTKALVVKAKFSAPPLDPNIALPSRASLLFFVLTRNGKTESFSVERALAEPATVVFDINLTF